MTSKKLDMADAASGAEWTPDRVLALRVKLRLTQLQAAKSVGVGKSLWCQWEKGRARVTRPFEILLSLLENGTIAAEVKAG